MSNTTIKDIAKQANVSIGTVSRILNNSGKGYSQSTFDHVVKIANSLNYTPNHMARALITKKTGTVGLIVRNILNPFFPNLAKGVEETLSHNDISILLCNSNDSLEKEGKNIRLLKEKMVDGIILSTPSLKNNPNIKELLSFNIPFVILDAESDSSSFINVSVDNYEGAKLAISYLIKQGHKKIAVITGPKDLDSSQARLKGYKDALLENDIEYNPDLIIQGNYFGDSVERAIEVLSNHEYTAIFAFNDLMAITACNILRMNGLKVPEDVSIIGFDDIKMASMNYPPLTTVQQPDYEMGKGAAEILMHILNNKVTEYNNVNRVYAPKLIIRDSVAHNNK